MDTHLETVPKHQWVIGYTDWIFRFRWWVVMASLAAVAAIGYGAMLLRINPDSRIFFNPESAEMKTLVSLENTYSKVNNVVFVLVPHSPDVFNRTTLSLISEITKDAWQIPYTTRVNSLTNYKYSYGDGDDFVVKDLVGTAAALTEADIARIRGIALHEPLLVNQLISSKGDAAAITVTVVRTDSNLDSVDEIAAAARQLASRVKAANPDIDVHLTGGIMADASLSEATERDTWQLIPMMILLVIATLWIGLRSAYSMVATMAVVVLSMVVAIGWAGWSGIVMNSVAVGAPIMSMTLAIADCVHLLAGAGQLQRHGYTQRDAIIESMRLNWVPVLMTSVTTAVAFLAVNFADSPPINDVGNIVAVGVIAAWILSVTFFPALLIILPAPKQLPVLSDPRFLTFVSQRVIAWRTPILVSSLILVSALAWGIPRMKFDDDFIKYFSDSFDFRKDTEVFQNRITGLHQVLYSVPSGSQGGVTDPHYLEMLDEFATWFRQQDHVTHVSTVTDILKRLNRDMHQNDPASFRIPDTRELAAQFLLLYEIALPVGHDINDQIDVAKSSKFVSVDLASVTSEDIREIASRGEAWLKQRGMSATPTGLSVMYSTLTERNIKAMMLGIVVELVGISALMIFMLRSVKIGLVSLVPNLVPAIMAFGLWGWIGFQVNLAVSAVAAITFGIVVDDTIHSLTKYMRARRDLGLDTGTAVEYTYVAAGDPMVLTGITLILGFGVLSFSGFAVSHQLGLLSACIIALAIVADLVLLPPLLILIELVAITAV